MATSGKQVKSMTIVLPAVQVVVDGFVVVVVAVVLPIPRQDQR